MRGWELFGVIVWGAMATYAALCIFVTELRMDWWQTSKRLGTVSSIGVAVFFWVPTLFFMGIVPPAYRGWMYFVALLGVLIAGLGYLLDVVFPLDE